MTTIATDGKTIAADGLVVDGDTIVDTAASKVRRLRNGEVIGVSGKLVDADIFARWLNDGSIGPLRVWENSEALLLRHDGSVWWIDGNGHFALAPSIAAIGSGVVYALAALDAGASPRRAVEIACARDIRSGGTIIEIVAELPHGGCRR